MLLRIYFDEDAFVGDEPLWRHILARAQAAGLRGATFLQALAGYGQAGRIHSSHVIDNDRSVVCEIVDRETLLRAFAADLPRRRDIGLVSIEPVEVLHSSGMSVGSAPEDA